MFSFFKKKERLPDFSVFLDKVQLYQWLIAAVGNESATVLCFFDNTWQEVAQLMEVAGKQLVTVSKVDALSEPVISAPVYIADIYPIKSVFENEIIRVRRAGTTDIRLLTHLSDPFFTHFGGDKIKVTVEKLGMKLEESIKHPMITNSIQNAQEKLEKEIKKEKRAKDMEEWLKINLRT